jgi:hypothetical protein
MSIPIIFVRYAPGACGTFLLTLLSTAPQAACWDPQIQELKNSNNFAQHFLKWFEKKFTHDLQNHLKHEPHHPYKIDFFSAKHPRGNNIDQAEFIELLKQRNDLLLLDNIQQNKNTLLRLNKSVVPDWGCGNPVVNIVIDHSSKKWLHRTRWTKLFGHHDDSFILKEEHPDFLKAKNYNLNFGNQYQVHDTALSFYKKYVVNDPVVQMFRDQQLITQHSSNTQCSQHWIKLGDILNPVVAVDRIQQLADQLQLTVDSSLIQSCYQHYHKTNIQPILSRA